MRQVWRAIGLFPAGTAHHGSRQATITRRTGERAGHLGRPTPPSNAVWDQRRTGSSLVLAVDGPIWGVPVQQPKGGDPVSHCLTPRSSARAAWLLASGEVRAA